MKLTITGRHLEITEAARQQIDKKLQRLERLLNDSAVSAQCVLAEQRGVHVCELTVHARGDHMLHGVGRDAQLVRAVTLAADKVAQQAQKMKDRWKTRRRTSANGGARVPAVEPALPSSDGVPKVIRSRTGAVKPMTLDDAVLALSEGAKSFLVFRHASSDAVAILYKRPDGHFGLIEPEI
jgi:ribosome hibernation promoting factor